MKRATLFCCVVGIMIGLGVGSAANANPVDPGFDKFTTVPGQGISDFGFFDPGFPK